MTFCSAFNSTLSYSKCFVAMLGRLSIPELMVKQERSLFCVIRAKHLSSRDSRRTVPGLVCHC